MGTILKCGLNNVKKFYNLSIQRIGRPCQPPAHRRLRPEYMRGLQAISPAVERLK